MTYTENEKALIFLSQFEFMTPTRFSKLMLIFKNISDIFTASPQKLYELKPILKDKYEVLLDSLSKESLDEYVLSLNKKNIKCTTIISQNYPQKLKRLKNPPYVLYYTGNIQLADLPTIAIVGTRQPSVYGKMVTKKYGQELSRGYVIVSGMALGIDTLAHQGALLGNGYTIAVMGGGFDNVFPKENLSLAREIAKKGLVITEYAPNVVPNKYTFPTRNRIIAGLSDAVLITEAGSSSGSLYTKDYADEVGIETFCVPGQINSEVSSATNYLIQSGSARSTISPKDIFEALNIKQEIFLQKSNNVLNKNNISLNTNSKKTTRAKIKNNPNLFENKIDYSKLTDEQIKIIKAIKLGYSDFDDILLNTNLTAQKLNINLTILQISGIIKKLAGNAYILS